MKKLIKWAFRKVGYDLVKHAETPSRPFSVLNLVVGKRVASGQSTCFIQIGANDGVRYDPIRKLVVKHQLPGLLVEPLPDVFARLKMNDFEQPGLLFEQCAIEEYDGEATLYRVRPDPHLPEWLQGIASFDKRHPRHISLGSPVWSGT